MHLLNHIFDEIVAKGATRNFNTKPNEKLHGPLKKHYLRRTNFKNAAPQVMTPSAPVLVFVTLMLWLSDFESGTSLFHISYHARKYTGI